MVDLTTQGLDSAMHVRLQGVFRGNQLNWPVSQDLKIVFRYGYAFVGLVSRKNEAR